MSAEVDTNDRRPTQDPAEDAAFFPSPHSLSQYVSARTDFDGLATEAGAASGRGRVLVIATEERYMRMQNDAMFSTGNHPVETLLPLHHIVQAGFEVTIATPTGAPAKFEWWAFPQDDEAVQETWQRLRSQFRQPQSLRDIVGDVTAEDSDYLGVFIPGGHGAMLGLPESPEVGEILRWSLAHDVLVVTLCHGPAALLAASIGQDASPFAGYRVCAFPDAIDQGVNVDIGYTPGQMPWALGETLRAAGIDVVNDDMTGATTRDRTLLSGDSPLASHELGKLAAIALVERSGVRARPAEQVEGHGA